MSVVSQEDKKGLFKGLDNFSNNKLLICMFW